MNKAVKYSLVIPTRERHETLPFAIRSCLAINRDDFEVVVCDNASSPETKQVVDSFRSERLRYVRSDKRLNMVENWDLAVSQARGDFVTVLGDDDAVVAEVMDKIDLLLTSYEAVTWFRTPYFWPNKAEPSNVMIFTASEYEQEYSGSKSLEYVLRTFCNYQFFPSFYNSFIRKDVIARIKTRHGNKLFLAGVICPDLYSALEVMATVDKYYLISSPFSLSGISGLGAGSGNKREAKHILQEYEAKELYELYCDNRLPHYHNRYGALAMISDYLLFIRRSNIPDSDDLSKHMVGNLVAKNKKKLPEWVVRELISNFKVNLAEVVADEDDGIGSYLPAHRGVQVDSKHHGITDVCTAAEVYGQLLKGLPIVCVEPKTVRNRYWYGAMIRKIPVVGKLWAWWREMVKAKGKAEG